MIDICFHHRLLN